MKFGKFKNLKTEQIHTQKNRFSLHGVIVMAKYLQHQTLCCKLAWSNNVCPASPAAEAVEAAEAAAWLDNQLVVDMVDEHLQIQTSRMLYVKILSRPYLLNCHPLNFIRPTGWSFEIPVT